MVGTWWVDVPLYPISGRPPTGAAARSVERAGSRGLRRKRPRTAKRLESGGEGKTKTRMLWRPLRLLRSYLVPNIAEEMAENRH